VSGDPWQVCLERSIFRVAGMSATSADASPGDTAVPLTGSAATGLKPLPYYVGLPAGGNYSTIEDLHRFAIALHQGALLDPAHLRLLTTPKIPAGDAQWSLGLRVALRNGGPCYGHRGSAPGASADFAFYPQSGHLVVVLCNRGHPHALNAAEFVGARLPAA
jgi:CubicO group peptidase (beta-lactamase class C family)